MKMYRFVREKQISLTDFNQPLGMKLNENNRWVKKAAMIPWDEIEEKYAKLFPSNKGMPAKPLRMALGSLLIQKEYDYADRELTEQIRENPYYQLVEFRKRLSEDVLNEINEMIIEYNSPKDDNDKGNSENGGSDKVEETQESKPKNKGTLILDATCAPQNIKYPQDIELLNKSREKLEQMIDRICKDSNYYTPRMYRKNARKDYLAHEMR